MRLDLANGEALYLQVTRMEEFEPDTSYAVVRGTWPKFEHECEEESPGCWRIRTSSLVITVRVDPFLLRVADNYGSVRFATTGDGLEAGEGGISLIRKLGEREAIYGLGEHGETFNRNPGRYLIWNRDDPQHHPFRHYYCTIPFGVCCPGGSVGPHGFFLDNPGELRFDVGMGAPDELRMEVSTGDLRLWLMFEDSPADLLAEYTALTGRMERPPMWALGYQQCRWSYESAERVREIAAEFRSRRIPCDVIYLDIDYMQDFLVFTWNEERFPDPEGLMEELHASGFRVVCIVDPGVGIKRGYFAYEEGRERNGFFIADKAGVAIRERVWPGKVHHPDFTNREVRETWARWQKEHLLDRGVDGIWNDMNEPAIFDSGLELREYPVDAIHHDQGHERTHREIHNVYGLSMARASQEGQRDSRPNRRHFTLTRSGWAGVQRHSAVWTGDNRSAFATMPLDIALNLNMGMSGVPFVGCDIGGFRGDCVPELFSRWIEWGVFQPFCRAHSSRGTINQEPWAFGAATEWVCRRLIDLRYQLLPYVYTQFVEACESGLPVNQPLALAYPNDATVASIGDEFLLGPDLLVAPVLEAGKDHRALYLPAGRWIHFWSERAYDGGRWVLVPAPYGQPPLFVRGGAVMAMHPVRQSTREPEPEEMFLDVWPGETLGGLLVEDDGETMAYMRGMESRIVFSGNESAKDLNLLVGTPQGPYRSARKKWTVRLHRSDRPITRVLCNGSETAFERQGATTVWSTEDNRRAVEFVVHYGTR